MIAKLDKDTIFVFKRKHYKVINGQDVSKLPKELVKQMKDSGYVEKGDKDGR